MTSRDISFVQGGEAKWGDAVLFVSGGLRRVAVVVVRLYEDREW